MDTKQKVTITGVTGFLGAHVLNTFLQDGSYQVRGTVRDTKNEKKIGPLRTSIGSIFANAELVEANLLNADSIDKAIEGSNYVVHTASPFPLNIPKDENDLIRPAVDGTLAVLRACQKHKVKRVVITSSGASVGDQLPKNRKKLYTEDDWSDVEAQKNTPYNKSKLLAERAAWDFMAKLPEDEKFELVTVLPVFILGPNLGSADFSSAEIIKNMMTNQWPGMPKMRISIVDVRDAAKTHLQAIKVPEARNKRYISAGPQTLWFKEVAQILDTKYPELKIRTYDMKFCLVKIGSCFDKQAKSMVANWEMDTAYSGKRSEQELGIKFISAEESILDMANSLIESGEVKLQK